MVKKSTGILAVVAAMLLMACHEKDRRTYDLPDGQNAVYYWRTDLQLDSSERAFLKRYHINKMYCRYFDVVMDTAQGPMPNATLTFSDTLPVGVEMVPTVYITEDCMHERHEGLARKLVKRIRQMNETNDVSGVSELQIDCDYTARSRKLYYEFLEEVAKEWSSPQNPSSIRPTLSTTIRLHQLSMAVPPVDYGVLMLYNTGDPRKFQERNPILDLRDVMPYVGRLNDYALPLAAAYPVYLWQRNIYGVRIEHTVEADEILRVKAAVEKRRRNLSRCIVTYHLDKENINRYNPETYEEIYHH